MAIIRPTQTLSTSLNFLVRLKSLTFVLAGVLCNYQDAMSTTGYAYAQTPDPQMYRLEDVPVRPLRSDVLPQPSDNNQLLPPPKLPEQPISGQDDSNARFQVDRIEVVGSTVFKPEQLTAITAPFVGRKLTFIELLQVKDAIPVSRVANRCASGN